jgi:glutamine amidotransferase
VPNIGWSSLEIAKNHHLLNNLAPDARFYFSHSFAVDGAHPASIATTTHNSKFASVVAKGNVAGAQFHPEKSQIHGVNLLRNFVSW